MIKLKAKGKKTPPRESMRTKKRKTPRLNEKHNNGNNTDSTSGNPRQSARSTGEHGSRRRGTAARRVLLSPVHARQRRARDCRARSSRTGDHRAGRRLATISSRRGIHESRGDLDGSGMAGRSIRSRRRGRLGIGFLSGRRDGGRSDDFIGVCSRRRRLGSVLHGRGRARRGGHGVSANGGRLSARASARTNRG